MSDSAQNNSNTQQRRSKRLVYKPKPANYTVMGETSSPAPLRRAADTGVDETAGDFGFAARGGGQRLFDFADSVSTSEVSSSSQNEEELEQSEEDDLEYDEEYKEEVTGYHTVLQQKVAREETLSPHPILRNKVIATLRIPIPNTNATHTQTDIIPERIPNTADANTSPKDRMGYYFHPSLPSLKFPKRSIQTTWAPSPTAPNTYIGTDPNGTTYTVTPTIILRTFDAASHSYHQCYVSPRLLPMDPNSAAWTDKYHKWIHQIYSRKDPAYTKNVSRDFWTPAERPVLYNCINDYIHANGIAAFKAPEGRMKAVGHNRGVIKESVFRGWAERVNEVEGSERSTAAVRSQIFKARKGSRKVIEGVLERAEMVRRGMESGGVDEWPEFAIPVEDFPEDDDLVEDEETEADSCGENEEGGAAGRDKGTKRKVDDNDNQTPTIKRTKKSSAPSPSSKVFNNKTNLLIAKAHALVEEETKDNSAAVWRRKTNALVAKARALVEQEDPRLKELEELGASSQKKE
ncbi:hypothetical protein PTNB85_04896 [Pyrenophora teres f. teres]|uniref:Uncharacterized protein n=1 Tax=Pyrenophora teres f. teres TaxID=97479 RepID=A0A6S6VUG0_9PLEO|nr:hypothetical protein PTNB85_04896 [Pyrenophora teres f. teres]CAE6996244.1 hypothetical protein PTTW11_00304 [Pyrenophora teres f. teres]